MDQRHYRWVSVAAGGLLGCMAVGAMFSLPVLLTPMAATTGWSRTGISGAMTIGFLAMAFASMGWGALADRIGPRPVVLAGTVLLAIGLVLSSQAASLIAFQMAFGLVIGVAGAAILAPMMATVVGWFETQRSLAVSLVSAGMGVAPLTMSPLVAWLAGRYTWQTTCLVLAAVVLILMVPAALLIRRAPVPVAAAGLSLTGSASAPEMTVTEALRSPQFVILMLTNFCCCATHSGPIFHTVSYAITCGIAPIAAVSIYSFEGLAGMGGRIAFGILGDRLGAKRVLVGGLLAQAFGALAYAFVRELGAFYAVAGVFGFIYAGVMPLYAVLARENFPLRMMGTIIGGTAMAGSLGMAAGPLAGGWIYDTTASYAWLYVASFGVGMGAFLIATTFRPFPRPERRSGDRWRHKAATSLFTSPEDLPRYVALDQHRRCRDTGPCHEHYPSGVPRCGRA